MKAATRARSEPQALLRRGLVLGRLLYPLGLGGDLALRLRPGAVEAGGAHGHQHPYLHVVVAQSLAREPYLPQKVAALEYLYLSPGHLLGLPLEILDAAGG